GFRTPWVLSLARLEVDLERLRDPLLLDAEVEAALRALPGVGPFTAAQLLPLLGRPRPLVLDGWLRTQLGGRSDVELAERY
ncbi:DNA glycosylase family protein, partial [Aeromonas veronii]|uniref:hypothetical protein n=1 Tax=Aeromonas veronii TaxID=654 RepID=UPI0038B65EAC